MENDTPTFGMLGQMSPQAMLENARKQGKTEEEINAFAATQPITPVAIKAGVLYVRDVFGRVFAMRNVKPEVLEDLRAKGTPFTPFANRQERRNAVRAELAAKKRKAQKGGKTRKPDLFSDVASGAARADLNAELDADLVKALDSAAAEIDERAVCVHPPQEGPGRRPRRSALIAQAEDEMLKQLEDTSSWGAP